jgi:hypothetical protein
VRTSEEARPWALLCSVCGLFLSLSALLNALLGDPLGITTKDPLATTIRAGPKAVVKGGKGPTASATVSTTVPTVSTVQHTVQHTVWGAFTAVILVVYFMICFTVALLADYADHR